MNHPTESTALLGGTNTRLGLRALPPILPTLFSVQNVPESLDDGISQLFSSHIFPDTAAKTAFTLIILLQLYTIEKRKTAPVRDIWEHWSKEIHANRVLVDLEHLSLGAWTHFLQDHRGSKEIEDTLWLEFPLEDNSHQILRGKSFIDYCVKRF